MKPVRLSNLAEVYYQVSTHQVLSQEIELEKLDQRLLASKDDSVKWTAKDIFNILHSTKSKEV